MESIENKAILQRYTDEDGRKVTKKQFGKTIVTVKANEPTPEAIESFNILFNRKAESIEI